MLSLNALILSPFIERDLGLNNAYSMLRPSPIPLTEDED